MARSTSPFSWSSLLGGLLAALALMTTGCAPEIGDPCTTSLDCSQLGDRLCDTSQPEGYCTVFNCETDGCPEDSICMGFGFELDPACTSVEDPRWSRFERTFCMIGCEDDEDCRPGYDCLAPADQRAVSIDGDNEIADGKACFPKGAVAEASAVAPPACSPAVP